MRRSDASGAACICRFDENLREWKDDYDYHPHGRGCT